MRKRDVIQAIDEMISKLFAEKKHFKSLNTYNNGGIHYLRELKFKIEKMGTKQEGK